MIVLVADMIHGIFVCVLVLHVCKRGSKGSLVCVLTGVLLMLLVSVVILVLSVIVLVLRILPDFGIHDFFYLLFFLIKVLCLVFLLRWCCVHLIVIV